MRETLRATLLLSGIYRTIYWMPVFVKFPSMEWILLICDCDSGDHSWNSQGKTLEWLICLQKVLNP